MNQNSRSLDTKCMMIMCLQPNISLPEISTSGQIFVDLLVAGLERHIKQTQLLVW